MTDVAIINDKPADKPQSRQAIQAKTASKPRQVTGKLAIACKAIVWEGQDLEVAAKAAGLTTRNLRLALERRHVIAFLKEQREVFRSYISAQNIHHAKDLRNKAGNAMAKLGAMKYIDNVADEPSSASANRMPGLVVNIISDGSHTAHIREIEAKPLIPHDDGHQGDTE